GVRPHHGFLSSHGGCLRRGTSRVLVEGDDHRTGGEHPAVAVGDRGGRALLKSGASALRNYVVRAARNFRGAAAPRRHHARARERAARLLDRHALRLSSATVRLQPWRTTTVACRAQEFPRNGSGTGRRPPSLCCDHQENVGLHLPPHGRLRTRTDPRFGTGRIGGFRTRTGKAAQRACLCARASGGTAPAFTQAPRKKPARMIGHSRVPAPLAHCTTATSHSCRGVPSAPVHPETTPWMGCGPKCPLAGDPIVKVKFANST